MSKMYQPDTNFSETRDEQLRAQKLDAELEVISNRFQELADKVGRVVREDGTLNAVITAKSLSGELTLGIGAAEEWRPGKAYAANEMAFFKNTLVWCKTAHVSSAFEQDVGYWMVAVNFNPYIDKVAKLASNPHVTRVGANVDALMALSERTAQLIELLKYMDKLIELVNRLPDLDKLIADGGAEALREVHKALPEIRRVNESEEDIFAVSRSRGAIAEVARVAPEIRKIAKSWKDLVLAAKAIKNLKTIAGEVGKISED
jgi:hypothetical protein